MDAEETYLFSGGGTGGHLFPGIAVADALRQLRPNANVLFVGSERTHEAELVSEAGFRHVPLSSESLSAFRSQPLRTVYRNWRAYREAKSVLKATSPRVVLGLGGFASAPSLLAAQRLKIPTVLLEQNVYPGRATRWFSRRATLVCTSFEETAKYLRRKDNIVCAGNPVRETISHS